MSKKRIYHVLLCAIFVVIVGIFATIPSIAATNSASIVKVQRFENSNDVGYTPEQSNEVANFSYGESSLGDFYLSGNINNKSKMGEIPALSVTDNLVIAYSYDNLFKGEKKEDWHLISDSEKFVDGIKLSKKIQKGVLIVQKSTDGKTWTDAIDPIFDFFDNNKVDYSNIYTASEAELQNGSYYRVIIAYKLGRKTGEIPGKLFPPSLAKEVYEYIYCSEIYEFYACYGKSLITVRHINTGEELLSGSTIDGGFSVEIIDSNNAVTVKRGTEQAINVTSTMEFVNAGDYTIESITPIGQKFTYFITISTGVKTITICPNIYANENKEYEDKTIVNAKDYLGVESHTQLSIGHSSEHEIEAGNKNGYVAYGLCGNETHIYMKLHNSSELASNGWEIINDTWGKKDTQKIAGIYAGQINSGALIIQTSKDGANWTDLDKGRYSEGLFTTDYENYYGTRGNVLIYTPNGEDIINGIYVKILYAYELKNSSKKDVRIIEKYQFYLCSNELGAVTFHNLSIKNDIEETCEFDEALSEVYLKSETLNTEDYTVTGFTIDTSLNPTVTYTVKRNGQPYIVPASKEIRDSGRYDIHIVSEVNTSKDVRIYVDTMTSEDARAFYFGEGFIQGKRIYSDGAYACFEGGLTSYCISSVDQYHVPLGGTITNMSTGDIIEIAQNCLGKTAIISMPGLYKAVLSTNPDLNNSSSGDCRTYTSYFEIIKEGSAPGPVVNQNNLKKYSTTSIADAYPLYYGLTFSSAAQGNITLAFATKEAAVKYAYEYEQGTAEVQSDGTYRYKQSFLVTQKEKYESNWDLMDSIYYYAQQAVQPLYFDLSDQFTYITLKDSIIEETDNLRQLELRKSVVLFANDNEKEALTNRDTLPIISPKPYCYLDTENSAQLEQGLLEFMFIKDKYECDSKQVSITDIYGRVYEIEYNRGVGEQLESQNCPSGIVTINEENIYGDKTSYQAIYFAENTNATEVTLSLYKNGEEKTQIVNSENCKERIVCEAFSVKSIKDSIDPFSLVIVSYGKEQYSYTSDSIPLEMWTNQGEYKVKVVNRRGDSYSFSVYITESSFITLSFVGDGAENIKYILTKLGDTDIKLPALTKYGYILVGFKDTNGNTFVDTIDIIPYTQSETLTPIWAPKEYTITLLSNSGEYLSTMSALFGSSINLPDFPVDEKMTFNGWLKDGNTVQDNILIVNEEGDISLTASISIREDNTPLKENEESEVVIASEGIICLIAIGVVLAVTFVLIFFTMKRRTTTDVTESYSKKEDDNEK